MACHYPIPITTSSSTPEHSAYNNVLDQPRSSEKGPVKLSRKACMEDRSEPASFPPSNVSDTVGSEAGG